MNKNNMQKKHKFEIENNSRFSAAKSLSFEDEEEYDDDGFEEDGDICDMMDSLNQETMSGFMIGIIEAVNNQMTVTNELTKIVVGKSTKEMNVEEVFEVFKKAALVVAEASPLKDLMKNFPTE